MRIGVIKISLIGLLSLLSIETLFSQTIPDSSKVSASDTLKTSVRDTTAKAITDSTILAISDSTAVAPSDSTIKAPSDSTIKTPSDSTMAAPSDTSSTADSIVVVIPSAKELRKIRRDSLKNVRDSIRWATPRVLETSAFPDSLFYKRIISWTANTNVNNIKPHKIDTTYNDWYTEYPFMKEDVNSTYLGTVGSATQSYSFFKRREMKLFPSYSPYLIYSYTPDDVPQLNTKSPYTELAYWGTLLDYKDKEESSMRFLHSQNITPALNLQFLYMQFGAKGLLLKENTNSRSVKLVGNYLGKKYINNFGLIHHNITRQENGGVQNTSMVRDTTVDAKTLAINLNSANNKLSRNTAFINHHYNIPLKIKRDTADTLALNDGPMISVGHYGEISRYYRYYNDEISLTDNVGRSFYHDAFFINPTTSSDSIRMLRIENKVFFRLQPWSYNAVVSKIDGGVGYQWLDIYSFNPSMFSRGNSNTYQNNMYVYAGASGQYRKYLDWSAFGQYHFMGYYQNDFNVDADVKVSFYPFKNKKEPIEIIGRFSTALERPDWFSNNYYSNHYVWSNNFNKISTTKVMGEINIPKWNLSAYVGYSLIKNHVYYDTLGIVRQNEDLINVLSVYLKKNFKVWYLRFDNQVLFQLSSKQDVLPLPMVSAHLRYYFEFVAVKNALTIQIGADGTYNTKYYAPAYNPALGAFQNQETEYVGNNPYIDIFVNLQWKRASIFLKCTNVAQGKPTGDYFSAYQYIKPKRGFKVGIHWPFYIH